MSQKNKGKKDRKGKGEIPEQTARRREKVFELMVKGLSQISIAEALDVSRKTIERDYDAIRKKNIAEIENLKKSFNPTEFWSARFKEYLIQKKEMYAALAESKGDRTMVIKALIAIDEQIERSLKMAGIKITDVNPEDLVTETMRLLIEGLPDRKGINETYKKQSREDE